MAAQVLDTDALAASIWRGTRDVSEPIAALATLLPGELSVPLAYEVQRKVAELRRRQGDRVVGFKVGCTSPAIRAQLGIAESVFGRLWSSEQRQAANDDGGHDILRLDANDFAGLAIEGELAVTLVDASPELATEDWLVEYAPIIELHHSNMYCPSSGDRAAELIARNGIHAGVVRAATGEGTVAGRRCRLGEISLDEPIRVRMTGQGLVEAPVLANLRLGSEPVPVMRTDRPPAAAAAAPAIAAGPVATIDWLRRRLEAEQALDPSAQLANGMTILTATPGSLIGGGAGGKATKDRERVRPDPPTPPR